LLSRPDVLPYTTLFRSLPQEVAFFVAKRVRSNVRALEGALHRLIASAQITGAPITVEFAKVALHDMLAVYDRQVTLDNIQRTVADRKSTRLNSTHVSNS